MVIATDEQKPDLEQLQQDLQDIIQLTQSSILTKISETSAETEDASIEDDLKVLEGVKCKVPFRYEWGGLGYHNAIILGTEVLEDATVGVNVVFMHPTDKQMQPCPYYLEGKCKYSDEKCHFSHGYSVKLNEIRDYDEPDYNKIVEGCTVLAKHKNNLWYKALVEDIIENTQFSVKFHHCGDVELLNMHSVYPLDDDDQSESESSDEEDSLHDIGDVVDYPVRATDASFGHWEQHTKGIGSKLMAKMGYVYGSGLGKEKNGRIDPIEAMVFPPGRSLDRCMELREKAGGEDMLSVEKRLNLQKRKEENRLRQKASAAKNNVSVFDFINSKLTHQTAKVSNVADDSRSQAKMAAVSQLSRKTLNLRSFKIGEDIRRTERDMVKLKESLQRQRNRGDSASAAQIQSRLDEKQKQLEQLRNSDRNIANEQKQRKSSSKLTIF